jgi:hypothetical protein
MKEQDIISFRDFLGKSISEKSLEILSKIDFEEDTVDEEINNDLLSEEILLSDEDEEEEMVERTTDDDFYTLYSDKNENFICDIHIEGANPEKSQARLILESEEWSLMFSGSIENGKCVIPVKSLDILSEGQIGKIKLEVIAEGSVVIPWEKLYKVKSSKSIFVNVTEQKRY